MTQDSRGSAGKNGGLPATTTGQPKMANGIGSAIQSVQSATPQPTFYLGTCQTEPQELPSCDHSMLAARKLPNTPIQGRRTASAPFAVYMPVNGAVASWARAVNHHCGEA
jgi:hypothetical protein